MTGCLKSQEEFYLRLHSQLVRSDPLDAYSSEAKSLRKDLDVLQHRVLSEGLSFLTKTLPKLGKRFDQGLVSGCFNIPEGFKKAHGSANTPAFMQVYFKQVFDEDGIILDVVSVAAIKHLRQVLYFAYKLELPYSKAEENRVIDSFVQLDDGLSISSSPLALDKLSLAKIITRKVFHDFNHKDIRPRHGPGSVATGESLDEKWIFSRLYSRIHQVYPYYNYYVVGGASELIDRLGWYKSLIRLESGCAKVVLVPKDSRGPRLISCEPLEYQWIQQGLGRRLASFLEFGNPITRNHVNFTRQEINRRIAKTSSASQRYSTLDLKDASDRVSLGLVRSIFANTPELLRALEACRSTETKLPNGKVVSLNKFAPMGSALCFPVEAYIFWVIIVSAVISCKNLPLEKVGSRVFVYGDDIIVPTDWATISIQALEEAGLLVNSDKSCITGYFRESCGLDAYNGTEVTPSRLRKLWSNQPTDGAALQSYLSLANKFAGSEYESVANIIWDKLRSCYGVIPYGTERASYPCRIVSSPLQAEFLNGKLFRKRVNSDFQRIEFFLPSLSSRRKRSELYGWARLLRDVISPPFGDPSYIVLPFSMKIKKGWTRVA